MRKGIEMPDKALKQGIRSMRKHVDALSDEANRPDADQNVLLGDALEELRTSLEELQVAEEELRVQNEALVQTRNEIEIERQRYQNLFDFAPDGYIVTSKDGIIQEANLAAANMFSLARNFLIGKPLFSFVDEKDLKALRLKIIELSRNSATSKEEVEV